MYWRYKAADGADTKLIEVSLRRYGYCYSEEEISDACIYLKDKGLIQTKKVENTALKINRAIASLTPLGIDVLEGTTTIEGIVVMPKNRSHGKIDALPIN